MRQAGGEHPYVTQGRETAPTRSRKSPAWRTHTAADGAWLARRRLSIADSSCRTWGGFPPRGSLHQRPRPSGAWSVERGRQHRRRTPPDTLGAGRHERALFRLQHGVGRGTGLKPVNAGAFPCFVAAPGDPNRSRCSLRRNLPTLVYSRLPYLERGEFREGQSAGGAGQAVATLPRAGGRDRATCGRLSQPGRGLVEILSLDALRRVVRASNAIGIYVTVDNAKNDRARACYARYGCKPFPIIPRCLFLLLRTFEQLGLADSTRRTATGAPIRTSGCSAPSARRRARRGRVPRRA